MVGLPKHVGPSPAQNATSNGGAKLKALGTLRNPQQGTKQPDTLSMVLDAVRQLDDRKGASVISIRACVLRSHPSVDQVRLKYLLKMALVKGLAKGLLVRPTGTDPNMAVAVGRYKLAKPKVAQRKATSAVPPEKATKPKKKDKALEKPQAKTTKKTNAPKVAKHSLTVKVGKGSSPGTKGAKRSAPSEPDVGTSSNTTSPSVSQEKRTKGKIATKKSGVPRKTLSKTYQAHTKPTGKALRSNGAVTPGRPNSLKKATKVGISTSKAADASQGAGAKKVAKKEKAKVVKSTAVKEVKFEAGEKVIKPKVTAARVRTAAEKKGII